MLSRTKLKLHSKRGVSLVLALFLLLVCAFAGAAALTAASANAGRYPYVVDYQQQYLSVSSAARLIQDQLKRGNSDLQNLMRECIDNNSDKVYKPLNFTVTDNNGELEDMQVTVLLYLPDPSNKNNVDVIVQSADGEYALRFNVNGTTVGDIEQTFKREVS